MSAARSNRREVRNPILGLPVLLAIAADARGRADESWRKHKGPMAAYWKAASVYAGHIAKAIRAIPRQPSLFTNERNA
jgi:hypothetical protein